jgi:hypothetical protein
MHPQPLAYLDQMFLESDAARPIRILAEYLEPLRRFARCGIEPGDVDRIEQRNFVVVAEAPGFVTERGARPECGGGVTVPDRLATANGAPAGLKLACRVECGKPSGASRTSSRRRLIQSR